MENQEKTAYGQACKTLGRKPMQLTDFNSYPEEHRAAKFAEHRMETRQEAENFKANGNKPWIPEYGKDYLWRPWFYYTVGAGFRFGHSFYDDSYTLVGSRLGCKSESIADALGRDEEYTRDFNEYMKR